MRHRWKRSGLGRQSQWMEETRKTGTVKKMVKDAQAKDFKKRTGKTKLETHFTGHHDVFPLYCMFHGVFLDDPQSPAIRYSDRVHQE